MIGEFIKLAFLYLAQLHSPQVGGNELTEQRPIVQRPLDGLGREILACSLPLNADCQTGLGKDLHEYCSCAEGLICRNKKCVRQFPTDTTPVLDRIRIDKVAGDEEEEEHGSDESDPIDGVQRPLESRRQVVLKCSLGLGDECQSRRGKTMNSYCSCGEGLKCDNHVCARIDPDDTSPVLPPGSVRIDEVGPYRGPIAQRPTGGRIGPIRQRPIGGRIVQRPLGGPIVSANRAKECILPVRSRCKLNSDQSENRCVCEEGTSCRKARRVSRRRAQRYCLRDTT